MPSLPPFTAEVRDVRAAWEAIRGRVAEGRRIDPVDGCWEEPWLEIGTAPALAAFFAAVGLSIAAVVAVFFTRGPVFLALLGSAVAAAVVTKILSGREVARIRRMRREGVVVPGAWVWCDDDLAKPGEKVGTAILVLDLGRQPDSVALAAIAQKLIAVMREKGATSDDPALAGFNRLLRGGTWEHLPLAESWCGRPDIAVARFNTNPVDLPRRAIDRSIWPMVVNPAETEDVVAFLPPKFWWREDVEALIQP